MIKLKRLVLNNFMCVEHAELNFDEGVTLIVGSNGQGKSTVLQAVALCLLEEKRSDTYREFIMLGKEESSVSLDATISELPLKIDITLNKKQSGMTRKATYNGRIYSNSEVTELLDSFDLGYYADIIMSMQSEGDITKLKPSEREEYLQKLFQFDFTSKVEKLKEDLDEIKTGIEYNRGQIDFNTKAIEDRKKEYKITRPLSFTDDDIKTINENVSKLTNEITGLSDQLKERDKLVSEKTASQTTRYSVQQSIDKLKHEIDLIKSNQSMVDTLTTKQKENEDKKNKAIADKANLESSISDLESQINTVKEDNQKFVEQERTLSEKINTINTDIQKVSQEVANANAELNHAKKHLEMIKLGTCPECGHAFDRTDMAKYTQAEQSANQSYNEKNELLVAKTNERNDITNQINEIRKSQNDNNAKSFNLEKELNNIRYQIKGFDDTVTSMDKDNESLATQIAKYNEKMLDIPNIEAQITAQTDVLTKIDSDISEIDEKIRQMSDISTLYTTKQNELNQLQQKLSDYNSELVQNNAILQNNETIEKSIKAMDEKITESKKTIDNYFRQKATYDEAINLLDKTFPAWLILKTCQMLEIEMNNFIQIVFPEMSVKLFQNKRGVEFFYTTNKNNGMIASKDNLINAKMASGFEKALLSMAFKVALCKAYNLRFAFMDEIDQAGTEENSASLFKAILSNDLFDQLFVISHKPPVRDVIHSYAPSLKTFYVKKGHFWTEE